MSIAQDAMDYVQTHQDEFGARPGDDKLAIVCREFLKSRQPPAEAQAQGGGEAWRHVRPHANEWRRVCEQAQRSEFVQLTGSLVEGLQAFVEEAMAAPPSGGEVVAVTRHDAGFEPGPLFDPNGWDRLRALPKGTKLYTAPPSAPVGVDCLHFGLVEKVVGALSRLGYGTPEGKEEQAARAAELIEELCDAALAQQPAAVDGEGAEALRFLLTRIGSWTNARWDQHLRYEFGDDRAARMIAALAAKPVACDMSELCIGCEPRNADGACPDQQPAAVDGAMPVLTELVATLAATGTVTGGRIYFPERQTRELLKKACDALATQPGGSDNDR